MGCGKDSVGVRSQRLFMKSSRFLHFTKVEKRGTGVTMTMEKTYEEYDEDGDSPQVEKRDGRIVDFDGENIRHAIDMALRETKEDIPQKDETVERIVDEVRNAIVERYTQPVRIEDIQTLIEHGIINAGWYDIARRYTQYRLDKDIERSKAADVDHAVEMLIRKDSSIVKENANKDSNIYSTQRDLLAGAVSKAKAFSMLPKAVANAHMKGDIHFHDADYSPFTAQSNCFSRDTRFITDKGVKSFEDFDNGDEITVLAPSGKWNKAVVHSYGVKTLDDITFVRNGRTRRTIRATEDHRWILRHGEETTSLSVGDVLLYPPVHKTVLSKESDKNILEAWAKGFVYGDVSESEQRKKDGEYHCTLRLCGDKNNYLWVFKEIDGITISYPQHAHGDAVLYIRGMRKHPNLSEMTTDEVSAFFEGYMDADGSYTNHNFDYKSTIMTTNKLNNFELIEKWSAVAGYHISSIRDITGQVTPYAPNGRRESRFYRFIVGNHNSWKVESIEQNTGTEETWCLEVENERAFVLEGGITTGNCSLPNFGNMLEHGFALGNAMMDSPKSIGTATTQITQIIKDIASSQYGGQTVNRADELLEPYARLDYEKNLKQARALFGDNAPIPFLRSMIESLKKEEPRSLHFEDDRAPLPDDTPFNDDESVSEVEKLREIYAKILTRKAIYDAMQTMEYQINSNRVSNGQTPFVTVGFGLGTSWFAREIQRAIFLNRIRGLGRDRLTAIFPKLVFTIRHGVNSDEGDPNYDMKQLALECATKRMYPDVVFYENIKKITGGGFRAPMGAVAGNEVITWSDGETVRTEGFERMWSRLASRFSPQHQGTDGDDWFIDLDGENVSIKDSHQGLSNFVKVRRIISNQSRDWWRRITFNGGRSIECTSDHPFEAKDRGRVLADDLREGDIISKSVEAREEGTRHYTNDVAWILGFIMCDGCLNENSEILVSFADTGEEEIAEKIESLYAEDSLRHKRHDRGRKGTYREIAIKDKWLRNQCISEFNGMVKNDRRVPDSIFTATREERLAFLAGIIDADGYISDNQRVQIGSTNRELALGQMLLVESLGITARMYSNHYAGKDYSRVRYQVSFLATSEIVQKVVCGKKRAHFENDSSSRRENEVSISVSSVETIHKDARSYDVTTESDYFDVSGIVSHNCRSFLQTWVNPDTGEEENEGRMNLGVVTVNIPRIALESHGNRRKFWKIFEERLNVAHEALSFRVARCKEARPINAPTLYQNGAFGRLKKDDDVDSLFNRERATVSLGYIGLYEATAVFFGKDWIRDHDWDEDGKKFALSIVRRMKKRCKEWSENEGYWFSVYGTPAESLTDRFNRLDRKKFGTVPGVTDHDFYTNSFHFPVWLSPTPFEKLKFEEDFPHYASGGFINYCEFPTLQTNPKALEAVWDYAYRIGIGYLGTNTPIDHCFKCGFEGDFKPTEEGFECPECGNHDPDQCNVTKRTCGYLGNPVQRPMVHGRHEEIAHRVKHMSGETGHVILEDGSEREWFEEVK